MTESAYHSKETVSTIPPSTPIALYCTLSLSLTLSLYGVIIHVPAYTDTINDIDPAINSSLCIFAPDVNFYTGTVQEVFQPIDDTITSCEELNEYWTYLVSNMSLCFVALLVTIVGIIANCITPCVEDRYEGAWRPKSPSDA